MSLSKGMFAYPWTIAEHGIDRTIDQLKHQLLADSLYVSVNYHSGRLFQPLSGKKVHMRHESTFSFEPDTQLYPNEVDVKVDEGIAGRSLQLAIRQACAERGISYHAWMIGMHNSTVGRLHNEYCVRNACDDVYDFALCPNHPVSRAFVAAIARDVCLHLDPHSLLLESPGFLGFVHGHHHEKVLSSLGPVCEYLLSLCFCPHCKEAAARRGIDADRLQRQVVRKIEYLTEHERGAAGSDVTHADMAGLLMEDSELYLYTQMRIDTVISLIADIKQVSAEYGKELYLMPSIVSACSWTEGMLLSRLSPIVDGFMILAYFADPGRVKADIEWMRLFIGDVPYIAAFNAGVPATSGRSGLQACVEAALSLQPRGIAYYNMSMLTGQRLNWIEAVNRSLRP